MAESRRSRRRLESDILSNLPQKLIVETASKEINMSRFISAAKVTELPDQSATCVEVEGQRIALFNLGGAPKPEAHGYY